MPRCPIDRQGSLDRRVRWFDHRVRWFDHRVRWFDRRVVRFEGWVTRRGRRARTCSAPGPGPIVPVVANCSSAAAVGTVSLPVRPVPVLPVLFVPLSGTYPPEQIYPDPEPTVIVFPSTPADATPAAPSAPAPPPEPYVAGHPGPPKTFYIIPGCYAGDRRPNPESLAPGCSISQLRVIPPSS